MGRHKKVLEIDHVKFEGMTLTQKLELFTDFHHLFEHELRKIEYLEIEIPTKRKAEEIAELHYQNLGFEVYRSRVKNGYRSIGVEFYWQEYANAIAPSDRALINKLKSILTPDDFRELAHIVQEKNGTPDLLLIKDGLIRFVEVKFNNETVKPATVKFFLKYGNKWPISILRVICKSKEEIDYSAM